MFSIQQKGRPLADASLPPFDEDDLTRVRCRIYEAIGDLDALPGALMAAARRLNAAHVVVVAPTSDARQGCVHDAVATHMDLSLGQAFALASGTLDPWLDALLHTYKARPGLVLIGDQLCGREEALKSPWQSSVLIPNDCGDPFVATFAPIDAYPSPFSGVGFWRSRKQPRYELDAADRLRLFVRDLERTVRVALALRAHERERALLASALNSVVNAVFILRADCAILFANEAAEMLLRGNCGFSARDGKLVATGKADQDRLLQAMARACERAEGGDLKIARNGARLDRDSDANPRRHARPARRRRGGDRRDRGDGSGEIGRERAAARRADSVGNRQSGKNS